MTSINALGINVNIKPTMGCVFIGLLVSTVFYGVTIMQSIFYFQTYANDIRFLKALVTVVWAIDTLSVILGSHGVYTWVISDYGNPARLSDVVWSIAVEPLCTSTISLLVHLFMAYRIRALNGSMRPLAAFVAVASLFPFGMGICSTVIELTTLGGFSAINKRLHSRILNGKEQWISIAASVSGATLDVTITIIVVLQLHAYRKKQVMKGIIVLTGLITFFAAPKTLVYEGVNLILSKAQLNARESIRGKGITTTIFTNIGSIPEPTPIRFAGLQNSNSKISPNLSHSDGDVTECGDTGAVKHNSSDVGRD
ncbi:hypothetical protein BDQ17DRAFT_1410454 [Cyathus striatus]|nr:hypothetical protein BDQ17DRAFT_1410454 [Cyathus striatus]